MRNAMRQVKAAFYYVANIGPWYVVGEYLDDDGNLRRFRAGAPMEFDCRRVAQQYADKRNHYADTDPLGTRYSVVHVSMFVKL